VIIEQNTPSVAVWTASGADGISAFSAKSVAEACDCDMGLFHLVGPGTPFVTPFRSRLKRSNRWLASPRQPAPPLQAGMYAHREPGGYFLLQSKHPHLLGSKYLISGGVPGVACGTIYSAAPLRRPGRSASISAADIASDVSSGTWRCPVHPKSKTTASPARRRTAVGCVLSTVADSSSPTS